MFSDPHVSGDVLAWVDVVTESSSGERKSLGLFEVQRVSRDEPLDQAYAREEGRLRARFETQLATRVIFERKHLVLTSSGLVPPCDDCPKPKD